MSLLRISVRCRTVEHVQSNYASFDAADIQTHFSVACASLLTAAVSWYNLGAAISQFVHVLERERERANSD